MVRSKSYFRILFIVLLAVLFAPLNLSIIVLLAVGMSLAIFCVSTLKPKVNSYLFLSFVIYVFVAVASFPFRTEGVIQLTIGLVPIAVGMCIVVLLSALQNRYEYFNSVLLKYLIVTLFIILLVTVTVTRDGGGLASIYSNSNHFGAVYASLFFISILMKFSTQRLFLILLIGVILLDSRAAVLGMLSAFSLLLSERIIGKLNRNLVSLVIAALPALPLAFFYIIFYNDLLSLLVNVSLAGKNLLSGRFDIFAAVIEGTPPFIGLGYMDPTREGLHLHYSAHNLYLSMFASGGIFALAAGYCFVFFSVKLISSHSMHALACVTGYLVMEGFQVSLIGNFFKLSLPFWICLSLASQPKNKKCNPSYSLISKRCVA